MNKLELINNSVNEIREILGVECAPVEALPEMIRQMAEDPSRSGLSTIFVWSTDDAPGDPNSNKLDVTNGILSDLSDEWSQDIQNASTYSLRRVEDPKIWMSSAIFDPVGTRLTKWTTPVNIKGVRGENGIQGEQGERGEQGEMGPRGENASSYRTVSVYTMTDTEDAPGKPFGGSWDMATNTVTRPSANNAEWYLNPDEIYPKKTFLWMSQGTFNEEGDLVAEWCEPFRMTGDRGLSGADGRVIEFIYRLLPSMEVYNVLKISLENKKLPSPNVDDFIPEVNDSLNIGTQWKDQPVGITEDWPIEAVCSRMRKSVSESWSEWSPCIIWSKWGEDGTDGDGVEYIYLVTPDTTNEGDKMTSEYVEHLFMPNPKDYLNDPRYQEDEFCFNGNWGYDFDWTDEPRDVGPGEPMEWVSVRKKRKNDEGKIVWGAFSKPALWAKFAEDGYSYLTSFVFRRSEKQPLAPEGGTFNDPKPIGNLWEDTVPVESDSQKGPVWMSTRTFYAGGDFDSSWSTPKQMTDTANFQVEYTAAETVKGISKFTGDEDEWRDYQSDTYGMSWGDDNSINDPKWMATATCHNGIWSDWVITRIKGEKGEKGDSGSSVQIKGKISTLADLKEMWNDYVSGNVFNGADLNAGDGYYIESGEGEGLLYVYSGGYNKGETDTDFDRYWQGVELKGEPGQSAYIYTRYSNDEGKTFTPEGEPGKWIGFLTSNGQLEESMITDPSKYKWRRWEGEDGWGFEQIFVLTTDAYSPDGIKPEVPTDSKAEADYKPLHNMGNNARGSKSDPTHWADSPLTPSLEYPFCWVVTRKATVKEYGPWKGEDGLTAENGGRAAMYSRYSFDGVNNARVELTNDMAIIPMEGNVIDPDFTDTVYTDIMVYDGDQVVPTENVIYVPSNYYTVNNGRAILNLNVIGDKTEIPVIVKLKEDGAEFKTTWHIFKTADAYEITPSVYVIRRKQDGSLEDNTITVSIQKWNGSKWIPAASKNLFVKYYQGSNITYIGPLTPTNGKVSVEITAKDVTKIELYLTHENTQNGVVISKEDIGIIWDGTDGQGVLIKGHLNSINELPKVPANISDSYIINGNLYVWDGDNWANVGKFTGDDGKSQYIHIKYSNDKIKFTDNNGEDTGKYIGMYVDEIPEDSNNFDDYAPWRKFEGDDGWGYEYIYQVNNTGIAPQLPNSENVDGAIPTGWTDDPSGISESNRYEYMCHRVKKDGKWSEWIGEKGKNVAVLWAKWGSDGADGQDGKDGADGAPGRGITGVEEQYLLSKDKTGITRDTSGWSPNVQTPTADQPYLWNYEIINYTSGEPTKTDPVIIAMYATVGKDGVGIASITEYYLCTNSSTAPSAGDFKSTSVQIPTPDNRYLWNKEVVTYTDNESDIFINLLGVYGETGPKGDNGKDGENGKDGSSITIKSKSIVYAVSSNGTTPPTTWGNEGVIPEINPGFYLWSKTTIIYSDNTQSITYGCSYSGRNGQDGKDGVNGANGINGSNGTSIIWKGEYSSHPSNPQNGWAYKNTSDKKSYVYQDGWYQMTIDGTDGQDGKDGQDGSNGLSIVWKGDLKSAPENPQINWCYKDTDNGKVYIYNGAAWELMVLDGSDGVDGADGKDGVDGKDGMSVFITYHDNAVTNTPITPTGNGTTNGWHTNATSAANWISQKVAQTVTSGEWGEPIMIKGSDGKNAPSTPFAGNYNSSKAYYGNDRRTDVIRYNGKYYVTNQNHPGNDPFVGRAPSGTGADNDYWLAFGDSFDNIATGYLFAEAGHIEDLTVNAVKTYDPNTNQYIVIDDGTMTVYDKKENGNVKLSITGDKLGTIPNSSNGNFEWNPFVETSFSSDNIEDIYIEQEFTFTTTASPAIIQLDPKMTRNLWAWGEGGYSAMSDVITLMSIYIDDEFKTEIDVTDFGIPESGTISSTGLKLQEKTVDLLDAHQSSFNFAVNSAGSHVLKVSLQIQWMDNGSQGAFFTYKDTVSGSYTITYPMNRIAMGSNGLNVVFQDSSNKVQFVSDSNGNLSDLTLESTNYGVQVLPNGLKMKLNGTWYTASRDANGFLKLIS